MLGTEAVLGWIKHVEAFPGVTDAMSEDARPEFVEDLQEADGPKVFNVGEFSSLGQWDESTLFPEVWDMLGGP